MLVSIIIPCYNYGKFIGQTLENVIAQSYHNLEIIVIDDGSTDNTKDVVLAFIERDQRIQYFFQENRGLSAARNFGIEKSSGYYVQFLDADDALSPKKIQIQVEYLEKNTEIAICYVDPFYFKDQKGEQRFSNINLTDVSWMPKLTKDADKIETVELLLEGNIMPVNSPLVRRNVINTIGGFNAHLNSLEDWDFWLRAAFSFKIVYLHHPEAYCLIRVHRTSMSQDRMRMIKAENEVRLLIDDYVRGQIDITPSLKRKFLKKNNNYLKYIYSYFIRIKGLGAIHLLISILKKSGFWLLVRSYKKAIKDFKKEGI